LNIQGAARGVLLCPGVVLVRFWCGSRWVFVPLVLPGAVRLAGPPGAVRLAGPPGASEKESEKERAKESEKGTQKESEKESEKVSEKELRNIMKKES